MFSRGLAAAALVAFGLASPATAAEPDRSTLRLDGFHDAVAADVLDEDDEDDLMQISYKGYRGGFSKGFYGGYRGFYGGYNKGFYGYNRGFYTGFNRGFSNGFYRPYYYGGFYPRYYSSFYYPRYYSGFSFSFGYRPYYSYYYPRYYYPVSLSVPTTVISLGGYRPAYSLSPADDYYMPQVPQSGDFPYDGGPANPVPMPRADTSNGSPPPTVPLDPRVVSVPAPTKPTTKFAYPAYGEKPTKTSFAEDR